ncbi:hypothetical protein O6H91_09G111700 [Diphasiastrum complanatum]|uniref:Uncharacterized protein n=1 Tax=Diphasiastrum complanatum TaxID=34168 RepID=A0ACC2CTC9_DIPCM|nr:hypothetical protein O6H91_09G111700 [Diphasiastrum complanatum]
MKLTNSGATTADCCDTTDKCRCRWRWDTPGFCSKCHDKLQHRTCLLSSTFIFFLCSFVTYGGAGMLFSWLALSPFQHQIYASVTRGGCQPDGEGSWAIGIYRGGNPFSLKALEMVGVPIDRSSAWPVANPVLTCASVLDESYPSNFVADPFLYLQGGKMYVFFETKHAITNQGDIGVAESVDDGATWRYIGIALDEEWHLSYPFVFEFNGQIYMMPEGSKNGDLRLYRALDFPLHWTLEKVLIHKPIVDATMLEYDGSYWIFGSDFHRFGAHKNGELEIWYANNPLGTWKQHKRNPVHNGDKSMGARNGGRPFIYEGRLYRLGQDCGDTYGQRLLVFQVETLTQYKYAETKVPLSFEESRKGRNAWNGMRYHHMDVQKLSTGDWIAVMDRNRVQPRTCLGVSFVVVCVIVSLASMCVMVRCFFGRNGADEPYPLYNHYSQFTLLTMTYDARLWNLKMYIKHYSRCASVREIVVVWNKGQPPNPQTEFDSARFLELDDDIMVTCDDVERGFKAWRENPERIVGFYPSKVAFNKYWSAENERALLSEQFEYVHPTWALDTSKFSSSAISRDTMSHYSKRTNCLLKFSQLYGGLPLKKWGFNARIDGWDY